jgi:NADH-quinone oxidoreductase subunit M
MLLLILVLAPLVAAVIAAMSSGKEPGSDLRLGMTMALAIAVAGSALVCAPDLAPALSVPWFSLWGTHAVVHLSLQNDGLTAWLVQLVTWLTPIALLGARYQVKGRMREFITCVFAMEALMVGALEARDLVLFYLCYEGMLIPMVVIIALFGGIDRRESALWFFLYTMFGSVFMLVGIWYLAAKTGTTDLAKVIAIANDGISVPGSAMKWLFPAFALAFAVKVPLWPFHGWQPRTYQETPGAGLVLLAGAMAKIGVYGFIRFVLPIFPHQALGHSQFFIVLGLIGVIGGALAALREDDVKRMLAYSSMSHLGLVIIGIFTFTTAGIDGAVVQMVAHGFSVAALFLLVGYVESRAHTTALDDFGGLANRTPVLAVLMVTAALASAAMPGTANFIGEFELLLGTYQGAGLLIAALAGLSVILGVVYLLVFIQRWFYGKTPSGAEPLAELRPAEVLAVLPLLAASIFFGAYPAPISTSAGNAACVAVQTVHDLAGHDPKAAPRPSPVADAEMPAPSAPGPAAIMGPFTAPPVIAPAPAPVPTP